MAYTNSPLVTYTNITKHKTSPRKQAIDTITIHCIVGQWTAKQGCDYFANTDRECSANYVVGKDGSIGLSVEEKDRSWCSSSGANDHRAITIEVASDTTAPYAVTDAAYEALIKLVADVCMRNGIKQLLWKGDKSLIGQVDKQNMTVHRWFANKSCPGDYLYSRHSDIANRVNAILNAATPAPPVQVEPEVKKYYRVRKSWTDAKSQLGAYTVLANAIKKCKEGYAVFDWNGVQVYPTVEESKVETPVEPTTNYETIAREVIAGKWGNGAERKQRLEAAGYPYTIIQSMVNALLNPKVEPPKVEKTDYARFKNAKYSKAYTTTDDLNLRRGAGTHKSIITVIPKGDKVRCYGYYSTNDGTVWLYVSYKGTVGFCSLNYLR